MSLPIAMVILYGLLCLLATEIEFDVVIALILIIIEAIYDIGMKSAKSLRKNGKDENEE